ncbi:ankyrin repeat gene family protein [Fowlpox virus]|nr:ankyrin repeat gene family protein [Fowlpox virus]URH25987.1 ankyrin repeat gene family protein [Fowlpox virus]URH26514.1 ankyrin repeat gene family protein [Fowlpox virus]URH27304.1 ankyrin repeat gene family protein [Fowlpox virus]URH27568.1 ankyrin repeat gene family protein [Fowlpox virus]
MYPKGVLVNVNTVIAFSYKEIVNILLERGQDVNFIDDVGLAPVYYATIFERMNVLKLLCKYHVDINISSHSSGRTSLHYAVLFNHKRALSFLLARGADVFKKDACMCTPLYYAMLSDQRDMVTMLLHSKKYIVKFRNKLDLHNAIETGNIKVIKTLLDNGVNENSVDKDGLTPLHYAVKYGNISIVKMFVIR